ncbi:MAG: hypothetical protein ACRD3L_17945 [Terriglobales bacterium]
MRNLIEVLREKETALARVRQEVEALRYVAPLLFEQNDEFRSRPELAWPEAAPQNRWPLEVDVPGRLSPES